MMPAPSHRCRAAAILLAAAALARAGGGWEPTGITFANRSGQDWSFTVSGENLDHLPLGYLIDACAADAKQTPIPFTGKARVTLAAGQELALHRLEDTKHSGSCCFHFRDGAEEMELDVALRVGADGSPGLVQGKTLDLGGRFDEKARVEETAVTFLGAGSMAVDAAPAEGSTLVRTRAMGPALLGLRLGLQGSAMREATQARQAR